jgi:hypothetical protein
MNDTRIIHAGGLSCPQPAILSHEGLRKLARQTAEVPRLPAPPGRMLPVRSETLAWT